MKKLLASFCALALAVYPAWAAPSPSSIQVDRGAMALGQPGNVCISVTSGQCSPTGTMSPGGAFNPLVPLTSGGDLSGPLAAPIVVTIGGNAPGAILMPHVATNAQLSTRTDYSQSVVRDAFAPLTTGGRAVYTYFAGSCVLNGGNGDGGAEVKAANGNCWRTDLSQPISAAVWGVRADGVTDDLAAWQAATSAMGSAQGDIATMSNTSGVLLMPATNGTCSKLSATLLINRSSLTLRGQGQRVSCFDPQFATGSGVQFGDQTHYLNNVTIERIGFRSDVAHRTGGSSLQVWNTYFFNADEVGCYDYYYSCIGVDQNLAGNDYNFDRISTGGTNGVTVGAGVYGFSIGTQTASGSSCHPFCQGPTEVRINRAEIGHNGYNGTVGAAYNIQAAGGVYLFQNNTDFDYHSIWAHPLTGQLIGVIEGTNDAWDTNTAEAILFDTTGGGKIASAHFLKEYVGTCGASSGGYAGIPCVALKGPTDTIADVSMNFAPLIAAGGHGVVIRTGTDIQITGHITGNGLQNIGAYNGIVVAPPSGVAVKNLQIDARLGGSIGSDATLPPNAQNCGLTVLSGGGPVTNLTGRGDWSGNRGTISGVCDNDIADVATHDFSGTFPGAPSNTYVCTVGSTTGGASSATCHVSYRVSGANVNFEATVIEGSTDMGGGSITFTLPPTLVPAAQSPLTGRNQGSGALVSAFVDPAVSTTTGFIQTATGSYPGAANASFRISGSYRIAP